LRTVIDWLVEARGHHRFTIDPAAQNQRAIAAYEKVGFRPVGKLRKQERAPDGNWRDGLLMDLLAEDL
jgi:aminoglycoside 6'-N-acetyltransferase